MNPLPHRKLFQTSTHWPSLAAIILKPSSLRDFLSSDHSQITTVQKKWRTTHRREEYDGDAFPEETGYGEREGHAGPSGRSAAGRFPAGTVRPADPQQRPQRRSHFPRHFRRFLLGNVPGRQGQQDPKVYFVHRIISLSLSPSLYTYTLFLFVYMRIMCLYLCLIGLLVFEGFLLNPLTNMGKYSTKFNGRSF